MYETGISNVYVVLIEDGEEFLDNKKLQISEYTTDTIYEAELRGALNSLELSTDALYRDINYRICQLQRQQILTSQAMLQQQMEVLRDEKGQTLRSHKIVYSESLQHIQLSLVQHWNIDVRKVDKD